MEKLLLYDRKNEMFINVFGENRIPGSLHWEYRVPSSTYFAERNKYVQFVRTLLFCETSSRVFKEYFNCPTIIHVRSDQFKPELESFDLQNVTTETNQYYHITTGALSIRSIFCLNPNKVILESTIQSILDYTNREIRIAFLLNHYSDEMVFSKELMENVKKFETKIKDFQVMMDIKIKFDREKDMGGLHRERQLENYFQKTKTNCNKYLCRNLNYKFVLYNIYDLVSFTIQTSKIGFLLLLRIRIFVMDTLMLLGLNFRPVSENEGEFYFKTMIKRLISANSMLFTCVKDNKILSSPYLIEIIQKFLIPYYGIKLRQYSNLDGDTTDFAEEVKALESQLYTFLSI